MICIFPVLRIDTNIDNIHDRNLSGHNGQYWQNGHNGRYVTASYGHKYGEYWCLCEEQEKCRSVEKAESKNLHRLKSYGQNKIKCEIMAISFVFWARKWPVYRKHFPWVLRAHLYVFGISGARGMGKHTELIQNHTFYFLPPHDMDPCPETTSGIS